MKQSPSNGRKFTEADIPFLIDKIYEKFDTDHNQHFTKL